MRTPVRALTQLAAAALLASAISAQAQPAGVNASRILIGQSAPLTGVNAELGNDIRNGALAYFRKVNDAGGVHGRKIELVSLDDDNKVPRAEANTKKLVEEDGVFALFGYASATLSRPALPIVEKHKVPFLAPFTGADPMRVFNKHVYNMRGSYAEELDKIVDHFEPLGVKRFSIVYYDDVVGRENLTAVERALAKRNLKPVSVAAFADRAKPDIEGGLKQIAAGQPDVVILTTLYKATADFIRLAQKSGMGAMMASNSFPGASPLAKELGHGRPWHHRRHRRAAADQALAADRAGIPARHRAPDRREGLLVHLARVLHRRQGHGRSAEARRPEADPRSLRAGARLDERLRRGRLRRDLCARQPQRQLVRRAHRDRIGAEIQLLAGQGRSREVPDGGQ